MCEFRSNPLEWGDPAYNVQMHMGKNMETTLFLCSSGQKNRLNILIINYNLITGLNSIVFTGFINLLVNSYYFLGRSTACSLHVKIQKKGVQ